jgi:hypothetical protein
MTLRRLCALVAAPPAFAALVLPGIGGGRPYADEAGGAQNGSEEDLHGMLSALIRYHINAGPTGDVAK